MEELVGLSNKILEVDLSSQKFIVVPVAEEDARLYLGGKGLGLKMLYDRMKPHTDPLGEDNMIAFMTGAYMGTGAPCSGRFSAVTKAPLTGIMLHSSCGGPFGMALRTSGWDGLIIKGKAASPVYLSIDSQGVRFNDAKHLWGKDSWDTQSAIKSEGSGTLAIGPAGENLVMYANVCSGHRYLGRGGLGAVMGSKNLKAIVAKGKEFKIIAKDIERFKIFQKRALKYINRNEFTSGPYRNYGTSGAVDYYNAIGMMPVRNFTVGYREEVNKLSGQNMISVFNAKFKGCVPCAIRCGHAGTVDGKERIVPEYETVGTMGSNLEIFDPVIISEWNEICGRMGIDTISTGVVLGWVMEAGEKGLFKSDLKFGDPKGIKEVIYDIALQRGIGKDLGRGTRALAEKYGGKDFAVQVKGLEFAAYDPRAVFGMGLNYAVANRGACHMSSSIMIQESKLHMLNAHGTRGKALHVWFLENLSCLINSMHTCQMTSYAYQMETPFVKYSSKLMQKFFMRYLPEIALRTVDVSMWPKLWSSITGIELSQSDFLKAGERIHILERYMNTREGISRKDDVLPERFLKEGRTTDPEKRTVPLEKMLDRYYKIRGYDASGIPPDKILHKLGIKKN